LTPDFSWAAATPTLNAGASDSSTDGGAAAAATPHSGACRTGPKAAAPSFSANGVARGRGTARSSMMAAPAQEGD